MWAESIINSAAARGLINGVCSPKTMFFEDYSLLVEFDAYLGSKCTTPDIYTCDGAGLVVIRLTQDSARLVERRKKKEERKKKEDEQFAWAAILVYHFRNSLSASPKVFFMLRTFV